MATVTRKVKENDLTSYASTWTITASINANEIIASDSNFVLPAPTVTANYVYSGKKYGEIELSWAFSTFPDPVMVFEYGLRASWNSGTTKNIPVLSDTSYTIPTSFIFNSNTKTVRQFPISFVTRSEDIICGSWINANYDGENYYEQYEESVDWGTITTITLDAPPTASVDGLFKNTDYYYAKATTVSVDILSLHAYYGGDFVTNSAGIKFEIGNASVERHDVGSLYITLEEPGTFTPKVTVTDSRGQTYIKTFDPIEVLPYNPTAIIQSLNRVDSINEPVGALTPTPGYMDDEGTNAVIISRFNYPIITNNYMKPPIVKIDGVITNNVLWYTTWGPFSGFSGLVDFNNYSPTLPIVLYGNITDTLNTDTSYQISIACDTTLGSGTDYSQTLSQSFYLLSAPAGGHGLGVGTKVPENPISHKHEGFHVDMDAIFYQNFMVQKLAGVIQMFAGSTVPTGWLLCDGSEYLKADYPILYSVIGDTYGTVVAPTDSDHFRVPDFQGRVGVGVGESNATGHTAHTLGQEDGSETVTLTKDQMPSHTHTQNAHSHHPSSGTNYNFGNMLSGGVSRRTVTTGGTKYSYTTDSNSNAGLQFGSSTASTTATNQSTGGGNAHENMPPFIVINYIIATGEL